MLSGCQAYQRNHDQQHDEIRLSMKVIQREPKEICFPVKDLPDQKEDRRSDDQQYRPVENMIPIVIPLQVISKTEPYF